MQRRGSLHGSDAVRLQNTLTTRRCKALIASTEQLGREQDDADIAKIGDMDDVDIVGRQLTQRRGRLGICVEVCRRSKEVEGTELKSSHFPLQNSAPE